MSCVLINISHGVICIICSHDNKLIGELHVIISLEDHGCVQLSDHTCDHAVKSCDHVMKSCDHVVKPSVPQGQ